MHSCILPVGCNLHGHWPHNAQTVSFKQKGGKAAWRWLEHLQASVHLCKLEHLVLPKLCQERQHQGSQSPWRAWADPASLGPDVSEPVEGNSTRHTNLPNMQSAAQADGAADEKFWPSCCDSNSSANGTMIKTQITCLSQQYLKYAMDNWKTHMENSSATV